VKRTVFHFLFFFIQGGLFYEYDLYNIQYNTAGYHFTT